MHHSAERQKRISEKPGVLARQISGNDRRSGRTSARLANKAVGPALGRRKSELLTGQKIARIYLARRSASHDRRNHLGSFEQAEPGQRQALVCLRRPLPGLSFPAIAVAADHVFRQCNRKERMLALIRYAPSCCKSTAPRFSPACKDGSPDTRGKVISMLAKPSRR